MAQQAVTDSSLVSSIFSLMILALVFGSLGVAMFLVFWKKDSQQSEETEVQEEEKPTQPAKPAAEPKKRQAKESTTGGAPPSTHRLLLANLKGHTLNVNDITFSSNGKLLASCSDDRTARLWNVNDFSERDHKYVRANIEYDHATCIAFSPDSKAILAGLSIEQTVRVLKLNKKKDGGPSTTITHEFDFPKAHKTKLIRVAVHAASDGSSYVMTAGTDTSLIVWTTKGEVLERVDTLLVHNSFAAMSPCGNLVAASGFTSDVRLWQVQFKNGQFQKVARAFELKGHSAGVYSFSFTADSKRMSSVSKDGTWKIWDIDVKYAQGQEAYLLKSGSFNIPSDGVPVRTALSPDYFTFALSVGKNLNLYNAESTENEESVDNFHQENIIALAWYSDSRQLVSSAGRSMHVWHNPVGARASLTDLSLKLKQTKSEAMKDRIREQISQTEIYLKKLNSTV